MRPTPAQALLWLAGCLAVVPATLLAVSLPPSATFLNQAAALAGWGVMGAVLTLWLQGPKPDQRSPNPAPVDAGLALLLGALVLTLLACLGSAWLHGLPRSITLSNLAFMAAIGVALLLGAAATTHGAERVAFRALCIALLLAGLLGTAVGAVQVLAPDWSDGRWVAITSLEGRASGNLRQPNHLSSLLLWSLVAACWLAELGAARDGDAEPRAHADRCKPLALLAVPWLIFGLVLSASRTGMVGVLVLAAWGALDGRLSRRGRLVLCATPLLYAACWWGMSEWAAASGHLFGGAERLRTEADISSSRFGIWSNTLALIAQHPWAGVGWGEFNLAWSLTPFAHRPGAFFDHTHNLPLQLAVELGLPLGLLVLGLLLWALWRAWRATVGPLDDASHATTLRSAFMMVLLLALHSLLEYPLWYAYFALPAAFAWGLCLGKRATPAGAVTRQQRLTSADAARRTGTQALFGASLLLAAGGAYSVIDYLPVVAIFEPQERAASLADRIATGQRSWFFAHHADYAEATTSPTPEGQLHGIQGARHFLLDTRLMIAWSKALAASGDAERARHIAQRLREFRNPASASFFEPCDAESVAPDPLPFQCTPPTQVFGHDDFR